MNLNVNPLALLAGTAAAPLVANAIGRTFITTRGVESQEQANAELRRLLRNFAIFNAVVAAGLGYGAARGGFSEQWRSAALGGAVGTGLIATLLGAALLTGPSPEPALPPATARFAGQLPAAPARYNVPGFVSHLTGTSRGVPVRVFG